MIDWFYSQKRQAKRKAARDAKLKEELAIKAKQFDQDDQQSFTDVTEVTINGKRQSVSVDRITIMDVSARTSFNF